jgi:hypothetical protein
MTQGVDIRSLLDQGLAFYGLGEVRKALDTWKQVLEAEPGNPRAVEYIHFVEENWAPNQDRDDGSYRPDEESDPAGKTTGPTESTPESDAGDSVFSAPPTSELEALANPEPGDQAEGQADLAPGEVPIADDSGFVAPVQPIVESSQWGDLYSFCSSESAPQTVDSPLAPPAAPNSIEAAEVPQATDSTTDAPTAQTEKEPLSLSLESTSDVDLGEVASALDDIAGIELSGEASGDSQADQVEQAEWDGIAWSNQVGTSPVLVTSALKEEVRAETTGSAEVPAAEPPSAPAPEALETIQSSTLPAAPVVPIEPTPAETPPIVPPPVETPSTPAVEAAPETSPASAENVEERGEAVAADVFDAPTRKYQSVPADVAVRDAEKAREVAAQVSADEKIRLNPIAPFSLESSPSPVESPADPPVEVAAEPSVPEPVAQAAAGAPVIDADSPWSAQPPVGSVPCESNPPRFAVGLTPSDAGASALGLVTNEEVQPTGPPQPEVGDGAGSLMAGAKDLLELDDFSGAIELLDKVLEEEDSNHAEATELRDGAAAKLTKIYLSKLGDLESVPEVRMAGDEIIWLNLDHRAGFVLSLVDGNTSFEDILSVAGLPSIEGLKILVQLVHEKVIVFA